MFSLFSENCTYSGWPSQLHLSRDAATCPVDLTQCVSLEGKRHRCTIIPSVTAPGPTSSPTTISCAFRSNSPCVPDSLWPSCSSSDGESALRTMACLSPLVAAMRPHTCQPRGTGITAWDTRPFAPSPDVPSPSGNNPWKAEPRGPLGFPGVRTGALTLQVEFSSLCLPLSLTASRFSTLNARGSPEGQATLWKSSSLRVRRI